MPVPAVKNDPVPVLNNVPGDNDLQPKGPQPDTVATIVGQTSPSKPIGQTSLSKPVGQTITSEPVASRQVIQPDWKDPRAKDKID